MHSQSGVADVTTPDELGSLRVALRLLSYLPDNNRSIAPFFPTSDPIDRYKPDEELLFRRTFSNASGINSPLDVSLYLQQVVDHGEFFELQPERAPKRDDGLRSTELLASSEPPPFARQDRKLWDRCRAVHHRHQLALDILLMIPCISREAGFDAVRVNERLEPVLPPQFEAPETARDFVKALAPPPLQSGSEIVTPTGGTLYLREAPDLPRLIEDGDHFEAGQPLFIIEVMKMFNKVLAPFAGTIKKCLFEDREGAVVSKGERIFEVVPDDNVVEQDAETLLEQKRVRTLRLLDSLAEQASRE